MCVQPLYGKQRVSLRKAYIPFSSVRGIVVKPLKVEIEGRCPRRMPAAGITQPESMCVSSPTIILSDH